MKTTEHNKIDKFELIARQFFSGLASALLVAVIFSFISFYANGGSSLFNDVLYAVVGAGFGMVAGVGLTSCAYFRINVFSKSSLVLMLKGICGFVLGVIAVYLTSLIIRALLSASVIETASVGSGLTFLIGFVPLVGTVIGVDFRLAQLQNQDRARQRITQS